MTLLAVEGITKRFGGLVALKDVSLRAREHEILGLIGPNGAGKSTLFNIISGHLQPDAGRVLLRGKEVQKRPPHELARRGIGRTFQIARPFGEMTVIENVITGRGAQLYLTSRAVLETYSNKSDMQAAHELLKQVDLHKHDQVSASALPIGMQRRLEIARALAIDPELLLLDEPTAGLTHSEAVHLRELIEDLRNQGRTVILIEHNMPFAMQLCDRIVVLSFGQVIAEGTPSEVRRDPRVIDAYLGRSSDAGSDRP